MMKRLFVTLLMLNIFQISFAYLGFDTVNDVNDTQFNCFKKQGFNLFIANLLDSATGEVDGYVVVTMTSAISAGLNCDLYLKPCVAASGCKPVFGQISDAVLDILTLQVVKNQTLTAWIVVENDELYPWYTDQKMNQKFLSQVFNATMQEPGIRYGIRTNINAWNKLMGSNYNAKSLGDLMLWNVAWDGVQNVTSSFTPFGGFTINDVVMHQYAGNIISNPCYPSGRLNYEYSTDYD